MTKLWLSSDLHLGHTNILKFREGFTSQDDHDNTIYENLATSVGKRDGLILLGDVTFNPYWLKRIAEIRCVKKTLMLGNHDTEKRVPFSQLVDTFDEIHSLHARRNYWFSHAPIHPDEMRGKVGNIHGHMHERVIDDPRYFNVCVEQTNFKPITFAEVQEKMVNI